MTGWTKDTPLKVGLHPPEQCARGRTDCRSLAQFVCTEPVRTFVCCGEVKPGASPDPQDRWAFCVQGDQTRGHCVGTDIRIFVDEHDMRDMAAVLATGAAMAASHPSGSKEGGKGDE